MSSSFVPSFNQQRLTGAWMCEVRAQRIRPCELSPNGGRRVGVRHRRPKRVAASREQGHVGKGRGPRADEHGAGSRFIRRGLAWLLQTPFRVLLQMPRLVLSTLERQILSSHFTPEKIEALRG